MNTDCCLAGQVFAGCTRQMMINHTEGVGGGQGRGGAGGERVRVHAPKTLLILNDLNSAPLSRQRMAAAATRV